MATLSSIQELVYTATQASVGTGYTFDQTTDDALRVVSCAFSQAGEGLLKRPLRSASGLSARPVQGGRLWSIAIVVELLPFTSYTDKATSPISPLLRACGAVSLVTAVPGIGGSPNAVRMRWGAQYILGTTQEPCTIEMHEVGNGNRYRATDCVGVITGIEMAAENVIQVSMTLEGLWAQPAESTFTQALATYSDALPMLFTGASIVSGIRESDGTTECVFGTLTNATLTPALALSSRVSALSGTTEGYAPSFVTRTGEGDAVGITVEAGPEGDGTGDLAVWANWVAQASGRDFRLIANEGAGGMRMVAFMREGHLEVPAPSTALPYRTYDLTIFGVDTADGANYAGMELYFLAGA
jgi:hypothetical protein